MVGYGTADTDVSFLPKPMLATSRFVCMSHLLVETMLLNCLLMRRAQRRNSVPVGWLSLFLILLARPLWAGADELSNPARDAALTRFLKSHCIDCHEGKDAEAGLDLTALPISLTDPVAEYKWVRILDRVHSGEMPPRDATPPSAAEIGGFLRTGGEWIRDFQRNRSAQLGRVQGRRLTNRELERSLHAVLGIDIPLQQLMTPEPDQSEFQTVASHQQISHFHLERWMETLDTALAEAFRRALSKEEDQAQIKLTPAAMSREPESKQRNRSPELIDGLAVTWHAGLIYYGRIPTTTVSDDGWYRIKFRASGLNLPETGGVWCTVHSGPCVSSAPLLDWIGYFEATEKPRDFEYEAWISKGDMLEVRPADAELKKGKFAGGQVGNGEGGPQNLAGLALHGLEMEQFHRGPDNDGIRQLLFGALAKKSTAGPKGTLQISSRQPAVDLKVLVTEFAARAFRRPVTPDETKEYVSLALDRFRRERDFQDALRSAYRAILCSPKFLYFVESPGPLDDYAVASRLSYMLTGSPPDAPLLARARAKELHQRDVLRQETERLLATDQGKTFIRDFATDWLDLDQVGANPPDSKLFPRYDRVVEECLVDETSTYLLTMLQDNLSVAHLIDSDFTFLNGRLARYYEIPGISGDQLQRTSLKPEYHRGGLLTQGSVLRLTANTSITSPVQRGVWVAERLLGEMIPPPPSNVPAIEPDVRGAKTVREMLELHRADSQCASCHVKIDPPGFALENYDSAGQWRDQYVQSVGGKRTKGPTVNAADQLPDGRKFQDVREFQSLVVSNEKRLAENMAEKLLVYGTGAAVCYADRDGIHDIVEETASDNYGMRSILHAVIASPLFLTK